MKLFLFDPVKGTEREVTRKELWAAGGGFLQPMRFFGTRDKLVVSTPVEYACTTAWVFNEYCKHVDPSIDQRQLVAAGYLLIDQGRRPERIAVHLMEWSTTSINVETKPEYIQPIRDLVGVTEEAHNAKDYLERNGYE
jgi:hypothetical protein